MPRVIVFIELNGKKIASVSFEAQGWLSELLTLKHCINPKARFIAQLREHREVYLWEYTPQGGEDAIPNSKVDILRLS